MSDKELKRSWDRVEKGWRIEAVNKLIMEIGSRGRRFFHSRLGHSSWMLADIRGKIWFVDCYEMKYIYTHYSGRWKHFTHGGTMRTLVEQFRDYIQTGKKIHLGYFGPWPEWYCDGDLWGYGAENMKAIREKAIELGICYNTDTTIRSDGASY